MGYKPVCCKTNESTKTWTTGRQQDTEARNHASPLVQPASANQSYHINTGNSHSLTCKWHLSPEGKTYCSICVYNTEYVGFQKLIHVHHNEKQKLPLLAHEHWLVHPLRAYYLGACVCVCVVTHSGVTPELSHLSDPHGHQQGLPDFHLEHLSDKDLRWSGSQSTVIDDCPFKIVQQRLEMENQLGWKQGAGDRKRFRGWRLIKENIHPHNNSCLKMHYIIIMVYSLPML